MFDFLKYLVSFLGIFTILSGQSMFATWISTDSQVIENQDAIIIVKPKLKVSWLLNDSEYKLPATIEFKIEKPIESRFAILWNFNEAGVFEHSLGSPFFSRLLFSPTSSYSQSGKKRQDLQNNIQGTVKIRIEKNKSIISINGEIVATLPHSTIEYVTAAFEVQGNQNSNDFKLTNFKINYSRGVREKFLISQSNIDANRKATLFATEPMQTNIADLANLVASIEQAATFKVTKGDIVFATYSKEGGYNASHHNDPFGWVFANNSNMAMQPALAHEIAHFYGCMGGWCDWQQERWLWEGFASYLGNRGLNKFLGRPEWDFDITRSNPYQFPEPFSLGAMNDAPLSLHRTETNSKFGGEAGWNIAAYSKGYSFLQLLSELVGYETVSEIIKNNYGKNDIKGENILKQLGSASNKDLSFLINGWLKTGTYAKFNPLDAKDEDGDGLSNFQEVIRGTNPSKYDSDNDGQTDFEELELGTDPNDSNKFTNNKKWRLDGFGYDFVQSKTTKVLTQAESNNAAGHWEKLLIDFQDESIIGAGLMRKDVTTDSRLTIAGLYLTDAKSHRLKITWSNNNVNELEWLDNYAGPRLNKDQFISLCSPVGCEFKIPRNIFESDILSVYFLRGGYLNGKWISTSISGKISD